MDAMDCVPPINVSATIESPEHCDAKLHLRCWGWGLSSWPFGTDETEPNMSMFFLLYAWNPVRIISH